MNDDELRDAALRALLVRRPDALVAAIDEGGLFVPVPDSIPLAGHRVSRARSGIDLVGDEDRLTLIDAWARCRATGGARATVRAAGTSGTRVVLHFWDVTATHGVHMGVLVPLEGEGEQLEEVAGIAAAPPRLVRTRKSELAVLVEVDADVTAVLGWAPDELVGRRSIDLIHPDDHGKAVDSWMETLAKPGATGRSRLRHRHRDGRWVWLEISNRNLLDHPDGGHIECEMLDISEEMEALEAVRASEQLLRRLAGALPVGVVQVDADGRLVYANDQLYRIFGASEEVPVGRLLPCVRETDDLAAAMAAVLDGADTDIEVQIERLDGTGRRRCTLALRALTSPEGAVTGAVGSLTDITDAFRMRAELERRATYDELTGCINRSTAMDALAGALSAPGRNTAVVFVDVDQFKDVNDRLGHQAGDALLVAIANRLRLAVRGGDVVGRIGGDEFLAICPDVVAPAEGLAIGDRLADAIATPIEIDGALLVPSASVGVAWAPGVVDGDSLIAQADAAMYESKRAGGGRAVLASLTGLGRCPAGLGGDSGVGGDGAPVEVVAHPHV